MRTKISGIRGTLAALVVLGVASVPAARAKDYAECIAFNQAVIRRAAN